MPSLWLPLIRSSRSPHAHLQPPQELDSSWQLPDCGQGCVLAMAEPELRTPVLGCTVWSHGQNLLLSGALPLVLRFRRKPVHVSFCRYCSPFPCHGLPALASKYETLEWFRAWEPFSLPDCRDPKPGLPGPHRSQPLCVAQTLRSLLQQHSAVSWCSRRANIPRRAWQQESGLYKMHLKSLCGLRLSWDLSFSMQGYVNTRITSSEHPSPGMGWSRAEYNCGKPKQDRRAAVSAPLPTLCVGQCVIKSLGILVQAEHPLAGWAGWQLQCRRRPGSAKRSAEHSGRYTLLTDPSGLGENKQIQAKAVALARLSRQGYDLAMSSYEENLSDVPGRIWLLGKLHLKNHKQSWTWRTPGGLRPPNLSPSSLEISRFSFEITGCEFETRGERGRITAFTFMHNLPFYFPLLSGGYLVNQAPLAGLRILILFVGSR